MIILGIETSCDETAASVVHDADQPNDRILSNVVLSQENYHRPFGGIVPEIAARAHLQNIDRIIEQAMAESGIEFDQLDGVAATAGPGLIGGVIVGVMSAKAIASVHGLPFFAVNHLAGHALTARLTSDLEFPYLLLLVSGGHCQLLVVDGADRYQRLGTTVDDALGEAFDKSAKLLGLGYPGGPAVEERALEGDPSRFDLPRPMAGRANCNFSFSGLKSAVRRKVELFGGDGPAPQDVADLCAGFQAAAGEVIQDRCRQALKIYRKMYDLQPRLVVAGGVAANRALRRCLSDLALQEGISLQAPPIGLCTDNAAMIAWAGLERFRLNGEGDSLDFAPRPRWPLDPDAPPAIGAGVKA